MILMFYIATRHIRCQPGLFKGYPTQNLQRRPRLKSGLFAIEAPGRFKQPPWRIKNAAYISLSATLSDNRWVPSAALFGFAYLSLLAQYPATLSGGQDKAPAKICQVLKPVRPIQDYRDTLTHAWMRFRNTLGQERVLSLAKNNTSMTP